MFNPCVSGSRERKKRVFQREKDRERLSINFLIDVQSTCVSLDREEDERIKEETEKQQKEKLTDGLTIRVFFEWMNRDSTFLFTEKSNM